MCGVVILVVFLVIFFICYFNPRVDRYERKNKGCADGPCNIFERARDQGYISTKEYLNIMKEYNGGHPCTCKTPLCDQLYIAIYNGFINPCG